MIALPEWPQLEQLWLSSLTITARGAESLGKYPQLQLLGLNWSNIGDDVLAGLPELEKLEYLEFWRSKVSDEGLAELSKFPALQELHASGSNLTGDGLRHLQHHQLSVLHIKKLMQAEKAVPFLASMPRLRNLRLESDLTDSDYHALCRKLGTDVITDVKGNNISQAARDMERKFNENVVFDFRPASRSAFPIQVAKLESLIRMLYDIEDQIRDLDDAERLARRQSLSRHVLSLIEDYLSSEAMSASLVLPKSNLGQAVAYVRRHWEALNRFAADARIPLDNNDCEQLMKRVATGRKNWLFKGSLAAGERTANLMTIIGSAVRNDLDVHAYLDDVLRRVLAGETDWASLAPHAWKAEHPESLRTYRQDERRQAADRKRVRRARRRKQKSSLPA